MDTEQQPEPKQVSIAWAAALFAGVGIALASQMQWLWTSTPRALAHLEGQGVDISGIFTAYSANCRASGYPGGIRYYVRHEDGTMTLGDVCQGPFMETRSSIQTMREGDYHAVLAPTDRHAYLVKGGFPFSLR